MKYSATLMRGKTYTYKGEVFEGGKPKVIDEKTKEHLEEHAFDIITVEGRSEPRAKFKFSTVNEDKDTEAKPARERRRKPDEDPAQTEAA